MIRHPPRSTLLPSTTLSRPREERGGDRRAGQREEADECDEGGGRPPPQPPTDAQLHPAVDVPADRKSTRLNSSHANISYAVFCLKKKNIYSTPCYLTSLFTH